MYIATFLSKHVIPTCFADYVTSTSGAIRLAFDLSPWPQVEIGDAKRLEDWQWVDGIARVMFKHKYVYIQYINTVYIYIV